MALTSVTKTFSELGPELATAFQFWREHSTVRQSTQGVKDLAIDVTTPGLLSDADGIFYRFGRRRPVCNDCQAVSSQEWSTPDFRGIETCAKGGE